MAFSDHTVKPHHRGAAMAKPYGNRSKKKLMPDVVVAKCKLVWDSLVGPAVSCRPDGFMGGYDYEFSCTTTLTVPSGRRRRRRLSPCVGGRRPEEMSVRSTIAVPRTEFLTAAPFESHCCSSGWPSEGEEIDGRVEEFINRFHRQLRMQRLAELLEQR